MLASALVPEKLSAIRRCPQFGVSAIGRFLKYSIYGKRSWYIASLGPRPFLRYLCACAGKGEGQERNGVSRPLPPGEGSGDFR